MLILAIALVKHLRASFPGISAFGALSPVSTQAHEHIKESGGEITITKRHTNL
jgi:hypothetical protein